MIGSSNPPMEEFPEAHFFPGGDSPFALPLGTVELAEGVDEIPPEIYSQYMRVVEDRILPAGMYLSDIGIYLSNGIYYTVDWRDLTLESKSNHRIRPRFLSSKHQIQEEIDRYNALTKEHSILLEQGAGE